MNNCIIHPIPLAAVRIDKPKMTYHQNYGQLVDNIMYVWYVEGAGQKILVDGGASVEYFNEVRKFPAKQIETLTSGMDRIGIGFDDIDLIIATHLHHDHISEAHRFPKAKVLVQRNELEFARNPHPVAAEHYCKEFFDGLNFEIIDGDQEISQEISVFSTAGHSPGGQSVKVNTAKGTVVICGLCTIEDNFDPPSPFSERMPVIAPGIINNTFDAYDSVLRIKEMADIVVPLHGTGFRQGANIP